MNHKNLFRILVVLSLVLSIMSVVWDYIFPNEIVSKLMVYLFELKPVDMEVGSLDIIYSVSILLLLFTALSGLLLFKNWGRIAFVLCGVVGYPIIMMSGPQVSSGFSGVLFDLSNIASGVILAMMYLSPVAAEF
jgi:hypothetical protein